MNSLGSIAAPTEFPVTGRRIIFYALYDRRGDGEEYVRLALRGLRPHADRLVVISNGPLSDVARTSLEAECDLLIERANAGLDIGAHRAALEQLGDEVLSFDELLLTNDTWYGPFSSFDSLFDRMDRQPAHFWGMTAHAAARPHPLTGRGEVPYHLQSYWVAVRRSMLESSEWSRYWRELADIVTYEDAVLLHESTFTQHFRERGFVAAAAFDAEDYDTDNASLWAPEQLLDDGCPILKRRVMFHPPLALYRHAVVGQWVLEKVRAEGYPMHAIWHDLARNVQPKVLNATAGLLDVLPAVDTGTYDHSRPLRTLVVAHIYYEEMTDELLDRADNLPGGYDLVVTTPTSEKAAVIEAVIASRARGHRSAKVVIVDSNDGRDQSAFLLGARDDLRSGAYELVVKIHSKKAPQDGHNIGKHFASQQFDNLLPSPGYVANILAIFQQHPEVGIVYPPAIHFGYPTLGHGWWANRPGLAELCGELGIRVPLDESSPLAPYGSMFVARPESLRRLIDHDWRYDDFGGPDQYRDGGLAHILERAPSYAAGEDGFVTRTVIATQYIAISQPSLEFDLDQMTALVPAVAEEQFFALQRVGNFGDGTRRDFARIYIRSRWPGLGARLRRLIRLIRRR